MLVKFFPASLLGRRVSFLILLTFFIFPFQKPLLHKIFKKLSLGLVPSSLSLPNYFSKTVAFFPTEFILLALLCCTLLFLRERWMEFFFAGPSKYLTLLFMVALFSIGVSPTSNYLLMYSRWLEIAFVMVLFHSIRIAIDPQSIGAFLKALAWLIFAISIFECAVAILQYFTQHKIGLKCIGECDMTHFCTFASPNGERWIFDKLFSITRESDELIRASGTFPHPNIFAGFHFCALLTSFYLYFTHTVKKYRTWISWVIAVQVFTLAITFSRAAMIACFLATCCWFIFQMRDRAAEVKKLTLILLFSGTLSVFLLFNQLQSRGGIVNYNHVSKGADSERVAYQKVAIEMIKEHPWFGIGFNNFQIEAPKYFEQMRAPSSKVHNIYLLIACETGLVGFSFFLLFLLSILKNAWNSTKTQEGLFLLSTFLGFLFIGLCDFYFISMPHGQILFFGIAALLYVASKTSFASQSA